MSNADHCDDRSWQDALGGELTPQGAAHLARCEECARRRSAVEWAIKTRRAEIPPVPQGLERRVLDAARREGFATRDGRARPRRARPRLRGLSGVPRLALLCVGIVLGGAGTASLLIGSTVVGPHQAQAQQPFTKDCDSPRRPAAAKDGAGSLDGETIVVAGVWKGSEAENFEAVLQPFEEQTGADVRYVVADRKDIAEAINGRLARRCPPDIALLPQPGLLNELAKRALEPLDYFVGDLVRANYSRAWREMAQVDGTTYGVWFKASHKSNLWYSKRALGGLRPPETWEQLKAVATQLSASQQTVAPFAIAGQDGWTLTDWFENVYLRVAGEERYDQLSEGAIPWTHASVKLALRRLAEIFAKSDWIAGGINGARRTSNKHSVLKVFGSARTAAMLSEGDFVLSDVPSAQRSDVGVVPFPSIAGSPPAVIAGGDVAVLFRQSANMRAAKRLMRFLADPTAAEPWVRKGGFISPNREFDKRAYPDPIMHELAGELTATKTVRFDMSDLLPPAFGAKERAGMWRTLQSYLKDPAAINHVTRELEKAAFSARECKKATGGDCT